MPNFTIRRRKPKVQATPPSPPVPEPVKEEKVDPSEMYLSDSSEEDYIDAAMNDLHIAPPQQAARPVPQRPQNPPPAKRQPQYHQNPRPQYKNPTSLVQQPPKATSYDRHFGPTPRINDPYRRKPTMPTPYVRPNKSRRGAKIRFRSHYGAGSEHFDTRTKSLMLLNHCFG